MWLNEFQFSALSFQLSTFSCFSNIWFLMPLYRCWRLLEHKPRWSLSRRGRVCLLLSLAGLSVLLLRIIHPFLAVTHRENTRILVVEGWIHDYAIRAGAEEFRNGRYERVVATGGPVSGLGGYLNDYSTSASIGAGRLRKAGIPDDLVQMAPSKISGRDRTYSSALALRDWLREQHLSPASINIVTEDLHARRTRLLFQKAFGKATAIGVIAIPNPDYDAKHWWGYSEGVREMIGETHLPGYNAQCEAVTVKACAK
jgi:uncharacterized SAM-binding protein YcdF (DUF218 family)